MKRVFVIPFVLFFTSCIGVKTEINVKHDLSGTARLEYTVSRELLNSGTLDGNANWPTVPVGRADFERTVARIDGLALRSYREKEEGGDRIFEIALAFDNVSALAGFLSANGQQMVYKNENGSHVFTIRFNKQAADQRASAPDDALFSLAREAFAGYRFDFSISVPGDQKTYSVPMGDLVTSSQTEGLEIRF